LLDKRPRSGPEINESTLSATTQSGTTLIRLFQMSNTEESPFTLSDFFSDRSSIAISLFFNNGNQPQLVPQQTTRRRLLLDSSIPSRSKAATPFLVVHHSHTVTITWFNIKSQKKLNIV
jgi:hypothetical protein